MADDEVSLMLIDFLCMIPSSDACSVCDHVIAEHYYSFRVCKSPAVADVDTDAGAASSSSVGGSSSAPLKVTHDYLMECVLCGKGTDEQIHWPTSEPHNTPHTAENTGTAASTATTQATPPTFSLASIQIKAPTQGPEAKKEDDDEWA